MLKFLLRKYIIYILFMWKICSPLQTSQEISCFGDFFLLTSVASTRGTDSLRIIRSCESSAEFLYFLCERQLLHLC
jgi:hypothetical protein